MRLPYDLIIFDVEANQPSGKIVEIGAVRVSRTFAIEKPGFQCFVNPGEPVADYIKQLCGYSAVEVGLIETAEALPHANRRFYEWATSTGKNVCLASWGNYDVAELHLQDPACAFRRKSLDIKSITQWEFSRYGYKGKNSLDAATVAFDSQVVLPKHRALPDALTTAYLLQALVTRCAGFKNSLESLCDELS